MSRVRNDVVSAAFNLRGLLGRQLLALSGHYEGVPGMSAFGGKADVLKGWVLCLLLTQSRHLYRLG